MSKEFQIRDGNLIASFDLENEDGDIDFCKLLKVSHGVADEIGMFVDYVATNKIIKDQSKQITDLEAKLAESEEKKESYRLQNDEHHLQLCQFYSRLGVEAFGADIHEKALETLMIMKEELEEKNGVRRALSVCNRRNDEFADMIKKLEGEKEELKQQLEAKEHTITNLVEDNRASQEWYKKQLAEKDEEIKVIDEDRQFKAEMWTRFADKCKDLKQQLAEKEEKINWLIEAEFNRKWAKKYVEMRRKEEPMLCLPDSDEVYERYFELKQQLAEKEKEYQSFKKIADENVNYLKNRILEETRNYNQDKISFAVEQIMQIREKIDNSEEIGIGLTLDGIYEIDNIFDNQIKRLEEMSDE